MTTATAVYHQPQANRIAAFEAVEQANRESDRRRREKLYPRTGKASAARWCVVPQLVELRDKESGEVTDIIRVNCKLTKCRPIFDKAKPSDEPTGFQRLGFKLFSVVVRDETTGVELAIKVSDRGGQPNFAVEWPQNEVHQTIKVRNRVYTDWTLPKVVKDGQKLSFILIDDFDTWMRGKFGAGVAKRVFELLSQGQNSGKHVAEAA